MDDQKLSDVNVSKRLLDIAIEIQRLREHSLEKSEQRVNEVSTISEELMQSEEREVGFRNGLSEAYRVVMQAHRNRLREVDRADAAFDSRLLDSLAYRPVPLRTEDR